MNNLNKTLKSSAIVALVMTILGVINLFTDIFLMPLSAYGIVMDSITIALSLFTAIIYFIYLNKPRETIIKKYKLFYSLVFVNIFNNLIVFVMTLWVQITINREVRVRTSERIFNHRTESNQSESTAYPDSIILDESQYEVKKSAENLTDKLEELRILKEKNLITEEEYAQLRSEAIAEFVKK